MAKALARDMWRVCAWHMHMHVATVAYRSVGSCFDL
jgi:hypothetical protein